MKKGFVALAVTGLLAAGPPALAAGSADPAAALPGYGLEHAGHDHGKKPAKPKPKSKPKHGHGHGGGHGHHKGHGDSAHASGGYDEHRGHPRDW